VQRPTVNNNKAQKTLNIAKSWHLFKFIATIRVHSVTSAVRTNAVEKRTISQATVSASNVRNDFTSNVAHSQSHSAFQTMFLRGLSTAMRQTARVMSTKVLNKATINPTVVAAQYAVRGELVIRAEALRKDLEHGKAMPFEKLIMCNIGNPQSLKQKPLTFIRQVDWFSSCVCRTRSYDLFFGVIVERCWRFASIRS
jgi:hypothetical protein